MKTFFTVKNTWEFLFLLFLLFGVISNIFDSTFILALGTSNASFFFLLVTYGYLSLFITYVILTTMFDVIEVRESTSVLQILFKIAFAISSISCCSFFFSESYAVYTIIPYQLHYWVYIYWGLAALYPICLLSRFYVLPNLKKA